MHKVVALSVKCPHCEASLMDEHHLINNKPGIRLAIETPIMQRGMIWLSSIYGDFNYSCEFPLKEGDIVTITCPHCKENLRKKKIECDACGAPIVALNIDIGGRVNICSRVGCRNHFVVFEDLDTTIRKYYDEFGYH